MTTTAMPTADFCLETETQTPASKKPEHYTKHKLWKRQHAFANTDGTLDIMIEGPGAPHSRAYSIEILDSSDTVVIHDSMGSLVVTQHLGQQQLAFLRTSLNRRLAPGKYVIYIKAYEGQKLVSARSVDVTVERTLWNE